MADEPLCNKHLEELKEEVRDEVRAQVDEKMAHWESVTSVDNPITISEIRKELEQAIK